MPLLEGFHDRRAAGGLHGDHLGALGADPAELLELVEGFPHADHADAAAGRVEDRVGQPPAELFGQLEAHGFFAFDAVGLFERRDFEPALGVLALGDDAAAVA